MTKETIDTTNKLIKPEDISKSDDEVIRQLSENLQDITPEDVNAMCDEMDEAEKRREEEEKEWEIPQELRDFRETWKGKIKNLSDDFKNNLDETLKKLDQIPVKVETDKKDGSRLIEFELGGIKWKILDPKLKTHSDEKYWYNPDYDSIIRIDDTVRLKGMRGDDVYKRENNRLRRYVLQKQIEGLHIPSKIEMKILLGKLGKEIDSAELSDQIAMLMYLTGMNGRYRLSMEDSSTRSLLECYDYRGFAGSYAYNRGNLCMIACEGDDTNKTTPQTNTEQGMIDFFSRVNADSHSYY